MFYPPVKKARDLIREGAIGEPLSIRIKSNPARSATAWEVPASANAWRNEKSQSGGGPLVFDDGHHKFALAWHFMGDPEEVHAFIGASMVPAGSDSTRSRSSLSAFPAIGSAIWRSSIRPTWISRRDTTRRTIASRSPVRPASSSSMADTGVWERRLR